VGLQRAQRITKSPSRRLSCYNIITYYDLCAYDVTSALHYFIVVVNYRRKTVVEKDVHTGKTRERERETDGRTDTRTDINRGKIDIAAVALKQHTLITIIYRRYSGTWKTGCKKTESHPRVSFYAPVRYRV